MKKTKPNQAPEPSAGRSDGEDREWVRSLGMFYVVVADVVGYTGVGAAIGYLAWKKGGAPSWVAVILTLAGFILAMRRVYQLAQKIGK